MTPSWITMKLNLTEMGKEDSLFIFESHPTSTILSEDS